MSDQALAIGASGALGLNWRRMAHRERVGYAIGAVISVALIAGSLTNHLEFGITEVLGFVSGALCVWLTVKEDVWNFPISVANNAFFIVLFLQARLFADMGLQVVYIVLEVLGWYWWLRGGAGHTALTVRRTGRRQAAMLLLIAVAATAGMSGFLSSINDSAPFLDALTTVLSLVAQYMLTRKLLENWFVWMTADVIYVGLYIYKHLYLTSGLYVIFLVMCVAGVRAWWRSESRTRGRFAMPQLPEAERA